MVTDAEWEETRVWWKAHYAREKARLAVRNLGAKLVVVGWHARETARLRRERDAAKKGGG